MTVRRFFSENIDSAASAAVLDADEAHHARDVLRLKPGDSIHIFDGKGREYAGILVHLAKNKAEVSGLTEAAPPAPESGIALTLGSVVIPGDKYDLIVQKAVELGVRTIVPLSSVRCELKRKDIEKKLVRWRRIALDAAKQCGRARLMQVGEPLDVKGFIDLYAGKADASIFFSERDGGKLAVDRSPHSITAVVGPKGGWDDSEIEAARAADFEAVTFGGRIMRAETAVIALSAILQHRFGDIN